MQLGLTTLPLLSKYTPLTEMDMTMLLWLDFETTGLDPKNDRILQVAYGITDSKMHRWIPVTSDVVTINREAWDLIAASQFIQDMHSETGLLDKLTGEGTKLIEDIEDDILDAIARVEEAQNRIDDSPAPVYLAGASVHFDKAFIENWMPRLHEKLSHRIFDTSTLQAFFLNVGIDHEVSNPRKHDAVYDILYCMEVVDSYRAYLLNDENERVF